MKFILKWLVNGVLLIGLLLFYTDVTFLAAAAASTVLTIISYLIIDLLVLKASNNTAATIADVVLTYIYLWAVAAIWNWNLGVGEIVLAAIVIGISEWFFHRYVFPARLTVQA